MAKKILVVDDEPNIVLSLEFLMSQAGYEVRTAENGDEALRIVAQDRPDLVLLDINLPDISGYEVCQQIRAKADQGAIKILMITAKGRAVEREKGLALGADDYITKPFSAQEVIETVAQYLDNQGGGDTAK